MKMTLRSKEILTAKENKNTSKRSGNNTLKKKQFYKPLILFKYT